MAVPGIHYPRLIRTFGFLMALGTIWACAYLKPIDDPSGPQKVMPNRSNLTPVYHAFDDILVPKAMRINRSMTALTETQTVTAGVASFEGDLDPTELIRFFRSNMVTDNWTSLDHLIGQRSLLQFEKHNRRCLLTITDRPGGHYTQLEIWVIPKNDTGPSGLLK